MDPAIRDICGHPLKEQLNTTYSEGNSDLYSENGRLGTRATGQQ